MGLDSNNSAITDKGIQHLNKLRCLFLSNEQITNNGLRYLPNLTHLYLQFNDLITDNGLKYLLNVKRLDLKYNTKVTKKGLDKLHNIKRLVNNKYEEEEEKIQLIPEQKTIVVPEEKLVKLFWNKYKSKIVKIFLICNGIISMFCILTPYEKYYLNIYPTWWQLFFAGVGVFDIGLYIKICNERKGLMKYFIGGILYGTIDALLCIYLEV